MNHLPMRGDGVEAWLKRHRDAFDDEDARHFAIDEMLDDYRLHSDEGRVMEADPS